MKEHAPIKRSPALVSFSKEHHSGLLLVWKIRQGLHKAVNAERISNYLLLSFKEELEKHFSDEEELLFCKLPAEDDLRKRAEEDHLAIHKLVNAIRENKEDTNLLNKFAIALEAHIRFEERELFNHIQNYIAEDELEKIAARLSNDPKSIDEQWKDEFWN